MGKALWIRLSEGQGKSFVDPERVWQSSHESRKCMFKTRVTETKLLKKMKSKASRKVGRGLGDNLLAGNRILGYALMEQEVVASF